MFNADAAFNRVKSFQVVSFDIFDTLLKRNVSNPKQIFDVVLTEYRKRHPDTRCSDFPQLRIETEKSLRQLGERKEITLDEIYSAIPIENPTEWKQIEIEQEIRYCEPNVPVVQLFNKCKTEQMRIVITSDMYLPRYVIEKMLEKCGVTDYEKLYLSSEIGIKKSTGELYEYVIRDLKISARKIVHIGDRPRTDFLNPIKTGMGAIHVDTNLINTIFYEKQDLTSAENTLVPFINNNLPRYSNHSEAFQWGYEAFGPLLLGYCSWLHERVKDLKLDKLFFLARDMFLVKDIYASLYGQQSAIYLEVSRRSLRLLYVLKTGSIRNALDTMTRKKYTVKDLLKTLGIDECEIKRTYDLNTKISVWTQFPEWFNALDEEAMSILRQREDYSEQYLEEKGVFSSGKHAIVDIGWHGTTQNMMERITGKSFTGLYLGTTKRESFDAMDMHGYWFECPREEDSYPYISMISILEAMLFPQIGTTIAYQKTANGIEPIYNECEMKDYSFVSDFQKGALTFAKEYMKFAGSNIDLLDASVAMKAFERIAFQPTLSQAKTLSVLPYEEERIYHMVQVEPLYCYLLHPLRMVRDFDNSRWKTGFIKRILPFCKNPHSIDVLIKRRRLLLKKKH